MLVWLIVSISVIIICLGVIIGILIYNLKNDFYFYEGEFPTVVCGIFGFLGVLSLIVCLSLYPEYNKEYKKHITNIMSVSRGNGIVDSFTLGCGTIRDIQYYFYYYETDKGVKLGKIESNNTYVIETNECVPSVYKIKEIHTLDYYYNLYVPCGTIITTYVLN